jgi:membrane protease YdiL (CAAX protease family)
MLDIIRSIRADLTGLDRRAVFALVYTAIGLTCIAYLKSPDYARSLLSHTPLAAVGEATATPVENNLYGLLWWVLVSVVFYFSLPAFFVKFVQKRDLRDIGLSLSIESGFLKMVVMCIVVMLPLVYMMSLTGSFSAKYPFLQIYDDAPYIGWTLLVWELAYFAQFFGLEFFFRGFLLHSLKPALGLYSIFAMTVPYTMIHFGKPMAETFAAIFAGIFLGWLSYKNGSIWLGLVLHCTVALSMDVLALYNKGLLF